MLHTTFAQPRSVCKLSFGSEAPLDLTDAVHLSDWLQRFSDLAVSREVLETLILQLAVIIAAFLLAWVFRAATRSSSDRLAERIAARFRSLRIPAELHGLVIFC